MQDFGVHASIGFAPCILDEDSDGKSQRPPRGRRMLVQVCYNLVNFLQRDEQDKQSRIDYLKGLAEGEGSQVGNLACWGSVSSRTTAVQRSKREPSTRITSTLESL